MHPTLRLLPACLGALLSGALLAGCATAEQTQRFNDGWKPGHVKAVGTALGILWCWRIIEIVRPPEPPEVVTGAASKAFWSSAWFFKFACDGEKCRPPWNEPLLWRRFACMLASGDVGTWTGAMWECTE